VAAVALCIPPTVYSLAYPVTFSFSYPTKRFYGFKDMVAIADLVEPVVGGWPLTTIDYWLGRAGLITQGKGARTSSYTSIDLQWFATYCLCHRCHENSQEANRYYDYLSR
jgi:hypothetical protein